MEQIWQPWPKWNKKLAGFCSVNFLNMRENGIFFENFRESQRKIWQLAKTVYKYLVGFRSASLFHSTLVIANFSDLAFLKLSANPP